MGRIKTALIKSKSQLIYKKYKDRFSKDFDLNKKVVVEVAEIQSKKIRNTIAGYITRLVKQDK